LNNFKTQPLIQPASRVRGEHTKSDRNIFQHCHPDDVRHDERSYALALASWLDVKVFNLIVRIKTLERDRPDTLASNEEHEKRAFLRSFG